MSHLNVYSAESAPNTDSACTSRPDVSSTTWAHTTNLPSFGETFGPSAARNPSENRMNSYPSYNHYSSGQYPPVPAVVPPAPTPYPYPIAFFGSQVAYTRPPTIDNLPSPAHSEEDLPPAHEIASGLGHPSSCPTQADASRSTAKKNLKGRGKQVDKENERQARATKRKADGPPGDLPVAKKQKGRTAGSGNYTDDDLLKLFELLEVYLPLGGKTWNEVCDQYNEWAKKEGRPRRLTRSLENKFKQLVKTTKPTGDAEIPWRISRALEINDLMNEKAGTRDLDDEEIEDVIEISNDEGDSDNQDPPKKGPTSTQAIIKTEKVPVARRPTTAPVRQRRNPGQDLLESITNAMSPDAQLFRSQNQAAQTLQMTQLLSLNSRIRDLERTNENLHRELATAERRADRLRLRLELSSSLPSRQQGHRSGNRTIMHRVDYPDGGYSTPVYHTNDLTHIDIDSMNGLNDEAGTQRIVIHDSEQEGNSGENSESERNFHRSESQEV